MFPHELAVNITKPQMTKLHKGLAVQLKHSDIGQGVQKIHLTNQQFRKFGTSYKKGKGIRLQFNPDQIEHHRGKGFFDTLKKIVVDNAPALIDKVGKAGMEKVADIISDKIAGKGRKKGRGGFEDFFRKTIPKLIEPIKEVGEKVGKPYEFVGINPFTAGFDLGKNYIGPALLGKGRRRKMKGKGAFEDFFTKTIPNAFRGKVDEYVSNPQNIVADVLDSQSPIKIPFINKNPEAMLMRGKGRRSIKGDGGIADVVGGIRNVLGLGRGGALFPSGYRSGGALFPSGYGISTHDHIKASKNGLAPITSGLPVFYEPYNPKDTLAIRHL